MIREFFVYSRDAIEAIRPHDVPHIIVSIQTPKDPDAVKLPINDHTLKVVNLVFHDLDDRAMAHVELRDQYEADCFSPGQARQILAAVKAYPEAQALLVHCDAGISRSPAVAAALSKILVGDDTNFFKRYHPNMRVYRTILEEHYAPGD